MRIEILVDNEEPQIFPLNKPKLTIGSHESCDIILQTSGVSRKHLSVITEDESFYVVDQGSTNGSYINEERLVPGRRVEFTSFFPVRLGDNILITLLSDEDANDLGFSEPLIPAPKEKSSPKINTNDFQEATRTISLKDLQATKTESLVKKRQETVVKRKSKAPPPKKAVASDKSRMRTVQFICVAILGSAVYFNLYVKEPEPGQLENKEPVAEVGEIVKVEKPEPKFKLVDAVALTPKEKFDELITDITCVNDAEKFLCDLFNKPELKGWGTIQVGTMLNSLFEGQHYYDKARELLPPFITPGNRPATEQELKKYHEDVKFTALVLFIHEVAPHQFKTELLKDKFVTFALQIQPRDPKKPIQVAKEEPAPQLVEAATATPETQPPAPPAPAKEFIAAAIVPETLPILKGTIEQRHLDMARKYGADTLSFLKDYFRAY